MPTRRQILIQTAGAAALLTLSGAALAAANAVQGATAITRVFGDGMRLVAIAVEYREALSSVDKSAYHVAGRHITNAYLSDRIDGAPAASGRYLILELNPDDDGALLTVKKGRPAKQSKNDPAKNGPGKVGDKNDSAPTLKPATAEIQIGGDTLKTGHVANPVFDDFRQYEYTDAATGKTVRHNLFTPKNPAAGARYPLVLFMHDAGVTGNIVTAPLYQGNGAIAWATSESQKDNPCFVLAPEYDEIIVDDTSTASSYLDATLNLIRALIKDRPINEKRLYTTGQSGGGMMSIAMNIKYPDFFAASYLVACQWNAELLTPAMKDLKWWITVSEDDSKAYPGEIAITDKLAGFGAKIARAQWNAQWTADEYQKAFAQMDAEHANINFVHFAKGSVFKTAAEANAGGASGHNATWKYAYNIAPIREWIFRQQKSLNKQKPPNGWLFSASALSLLG